MRQKIGPYLLVLALAVIAVPVSAGTAPAMGEECAACHEDVVQAFAKTNHARTFAADVAHRGADCTSCHLGAAEHAASGGDDKPASLTSGEGASTACLSCHEAKPTQAHWDGSSHQLAGLACASCHNPHSEQVIDPAARALSGIGESTRKCLECHGEQRVALHQRSSHPLKEGQVECTSCHDPHGSSGEKNLRQASVNELCYTCHQNLRGPFLWEHSPVREDCMTCHRAHGSNYPQLLKARVVQLCQSCHQQGRHQTLAGLPDSVWVANKSCLNCHSQVHGTNHPSGPLFQR